ELYELITPSRGGYQKVQEFGVRFAYSRVVIYVEPDMGPGLAASSSRSELKFEGEPLPWGRWAEEFAAKLPDEIRELEEEISSGSVEDHRASIRERLRPLRHLFHVSRYRAARNGKLEISTPENGGGKPVPKGDEEDGPSRPGTEGGTGGNIYALFQRP